MAEKTFTLSQLRAARQAVTPPVDTVPPPDPASEVPLSTDWSASDVADIIGRYGPKIGLQALLTGMVVGPAAGIGRLAIGSYGSSLAGSAWEKVYDTIQQYANPTPDSIRQFDPNRAPTFASSQEEAGINVLLDTILRGGGAITRRLTGKTIGQAAEKAALAKGADEQILKSAEANLTFNDEWVKALDRKNDAQKQVANFARFKVEEEGKRIAEDRIRSEYAKHLGMSLDELSAIAREPLRATSAKRGVLQERIRTAYKGIFDRVSREYDTALKDYDDKPLTASFTAVNDKVKDDFLKANWTPSPGFQKLLDDFGLKDLSGEGGKNADILAKALGSGLNVVGVTQNATGLPGSLPVPGATNATVRELRTMVTHARRFAGKAGPEEARAANLLGDAASTEIQKFVDPQTAAVLKELDGDWGTASNIFDKGFKTSLLKAEDPKQVIEALTNGSVRRPHLVLDEIPEAQQGPIRSALLEKAVSATDPEKAYASIEPELWQRVFGEKIHPKEFKALLQEATDMEYLMADPKYALRLAAAAKRGAKSVEGKIKQEHLEEMMKKAEADVIELKPRVRDARRAIPTDQEIAQRGAKAFEEAVFEPSGLATWLEHRTLFVGAALILSGRTSSKAILTAAPFITGTAAFRHAATDPRFRSLYLGMLRSKSIESKGYYVGRIAASIMAEGSKQLTRRFHAPTEPLDNAP